MLISKFDLYKREWLELVFDDRNKNYGAYELRQQNSRTMMKAMIIAFSIIGSLALLIELVVKPAAAIVTNHTVVVPLIHYVPIPPAVHPPSAPAHSTPATHTPIHTAPVFVPTNNPVITPPPTIVPTDPGVVNIDPGPSVPGTTDHGGPKGPIDVPGEGGGNGGEAVPFNSVERMPQPMGGAAAWQKFLTKNIKYPEMATEAHAQGAVWLSFIVEADGKLSNIKIIRGPGYGMDEEALRVLKLAPAWIPGMQNGHTVRVIYNIPIRFTINDDDNN